MAEHSSNPAWRVQAGSTLAWLSDRMTLPESTTVLFNLSFPMEWNQSDSRPKTPDKEKNWPALLILLVIFFTVAGNILLILAVSLERKLQNATSFILRSLAVADMLVGFLVMPVSLINILYDVLFSTASIMHLCTISLDRYVGICNPIKHSRSNSLSKAKAKIALVWRISIVISMPIPVIGLYDEGKVFVNGICVLNEHSFVLIGSFVAFFVPLVVMVVSYCLTVRVLQCQASDYLHGGMASIDRPTLLGITPRLPAGDSLSLLKQDPSPETLPAVAASNISVSQASSQPVSPAGRQEPGGPGGKPGVAQSIKNESRASKVLGVVFFLFLMMWCPFFITNVLSVLCEDSIISLCNKPVLAVLLNVFVWVGYASTGVNPLVYTLFNRTYRQAFHRYLRCIYHSPPAKSTPAYPVFPVYTVTHILCGKDVTVADTKGKMGCVNGRMRLESVKKKFWDVREVGQHLSHPPLSMSAVSELASWPPGSLSLSLSLSLYIQNSVVTKPLLHVSAWIDPLHSLFEHRRYTQCLPAQTRKYEICISLQGCTM
uniref:G-protein coupled receptors family 1 profile domain-containing protein n=1 Tax=Oncorhynchus tshawytscha TaxID=74940 RepID=A0AAZ3R817_ONCTS